MYRFLNEFVPGLYTAHKRSQHNFEHKHGFEPLPIDLKFTILNAQPQSFNYSIVDYSNVIKQFSILGCSNVSIVYCVLKFVLMVLWV